MLFSAHDKGLSTSGCVSVFRMKRIKVLLIDDDPDDRMLFQVALDDLAVDCDFIHAKDGREALDLLSSEESEVVDVIFLDINMPRMNGVELLPLIKKLERHRYTPVIVYSTSSSVAEIKKMLDAGAHAYLTKPHSYKQLCHDIEKTLQALRLKHA